MPKKTPNPPCPQRAHAKGRAVQRHELPLNRYDLMAAEQQIRDGRALCLERRPNGASNWLVRVRDAELLVGYDRTTNRIRTVLPPDYVVRDPLPPTRGLRAVYRPAKDEHTSSARARLLVPSTPSPYLDLMVDEETAAVLTAAVRHGRTCYLHGTHKVSYHQVEHQGVRVRFGWHKGAKRLVAYASPPANQAELHSSLALFAAGRAGQEAVAQAIDAGQAELVWQDAQDRSYYRVVLPQDGVTYCGYDHRRETLLVWRNPPRGQ